jgi:anti-anti-sigma factor
MNISTEKFNNWHIVSIEGEFVVKDLVEVRVAFNSFIEDIGAKVALDLSKTNYIDSSAVTSILNFHGRLNAKSGQLMIFSPNTQVKEVFNIINLKNTVKVFNSRSDFEEFVEKG